MSNPAIEECSRYGIPTVIVDRKVSTDKYTTFVSTDHTWMAATALEKLIEFIGGRGKIAIIEGLPGAGPAVERNAGYDQVLARHPEVEAIRQAGDWSRASGQRVVENIVTANPDLDGIHFDGGEMAVVGCRPCAPPASRTTTSGPASVSDLERRLQRRLETHQDGHRQVFGPTSAAVARQALR